MVGCRITFGLRPHVIRHPTIDIFPYYVNKQGITNNILMLGPNEVGYKYSSKVLLMLKLEIQPQTRHFIFFFSFNGP